jgi:Ca-activated chloride channel family protein
MISVLLLNLGVSTALADGMILPLAEMLNSDYLAVRTHHVRVTIEDGHAVTRVEQEFTNPHDYPVTGRYLFPVPPEAILSGFQASLDGERQQVTHQDASATNAALYAIVTAQREPSLLQYADWESIAFDVSLPARGSRHMSLEYEEVLAPSGGLYHYRYVLSTERYSALPLEEVSIVVELRSSSGLSTLYSSSHAVQIEREGTGQAQIRWQDKDTNPTTDFHLFFAPADAGFGGGLLTGTRADAAPGEQDHFLFLFSPEAASPRNETLPKDIVLVIDRSGSMSGEKIVQARNALHFILDQLGEDDRFSIVSFSERISTLDRTLQPVDKRNLRDARRFVDRLEANGSTDLESALQAGLAILEDSEPRGATRQVIFLTDGLPTAGITDPGLIAQLVTDTNTRLEARLHVFGVGYDVNTHLLDRLAADNGGTVTYVQPGEDLELALTAFYAKIAHPLLTGVEIEFEGLEATDLYPETLPDLFQGSSLLLSGRYRATGDRVAVRVRGWSGDEQREYAYHWNLADTGDRDFVPRLWATRHVGALLDRVRVEGESQALVEEIREVGLNYGIVTPYTTLIIEGQAEGAASAENMSLYGSAEVNQATGKTTIRARVQNQAYQAAVQANLASGANVSNYGQRSLVHVGQQQVDLSLLSGQDLDAPINDEWVGGNVKVDRTVEFGSEAYLDLATDPQARPYLQSGTNVVFDYKGEVIAVRDQGYQPAEPVKSKVPAGSTAPGPDAGTQVPRSGSSAPEPMALSLSLLWMLLPYTGGAMVLGLLAVAGIVYTLFRPRWKGQ